MTVEPVEGSPRPQPTIEHFVGEIVTRWNLQKDYVHPDGKTEGYILFQAASDVLGTVDDQVELLKKLSSETKLTPADFPSPESMEEADTVSELIKEVNWNILAGEVKKRHPELEAEDNLRSDPDDI